MEQEEPRLVGRLARPVEILARVRAVSGSVWQCLAVSAVKALAPFCGHPRLPRIPRYAAVHTQFPLATGRRSPTFRAALGAALESLQSQHCPVKIPAPTGKSRSDARNGRPQWRVKV